MRDAPRDGSGVADASDSDDDDGAGRVPSLLALGRTALDASGGALLRVDGDRWAVHTAVSDDDATPSVLDDAVRAAARADAPVTVERPDGDAGVETRFVATRVPLDDRSGVVYFSDAAQYDDAAAAPARAVVELVGRLVAVEFGATTAGPGWSERAFTETLFETVTDLLYAFSADGTIVQWNDELEAVTGYDTADIAGMDVLEFVAEPDRDRVARSIRDLGPGTEPEPVEADLVTGDGERIPYQFNGAPIADDGEVVGFAGVGRDVSEQRRHEETLTALHDVTRELLPLDSERAICERVVEAVTDLLDIEVVGTFLFDEAANELAPAAQNAGADEVVDKVPTFGPGEGIAWEVFMRGEVAIFDDVRGAEDVYNPETAVRSELFVPLGEHGILLAGSTATGAFDERTVELADLLAANAEAALDNVARKRELADRDDKLSRQHRRLERLVEVNDRVRRIGHALVGADSPEEITDLVCERLAAVERFSLVGLSAPDGPGDVALRATAGRGEDYFEAVEAAADADAETPMRRAARTREPVVVNRVGSDFRDEPWRRAALSRDFRSVAAFPLVHDAVSQGVIEVCADTPEAFDEETVTVLAELADMVAEATGEAKRRRAASAGDEVELVVRIDPWPDPIGPLADAVGAPVTVTRAVPAADGSCLLYVRTDADADTLADALATAPGVTDGRVVASGGPTRFELTTARRTVAAALRDAGGRFVRLDLSDGAARLVARVPAATDVRELVERLGDDGTVTVLAQRTDPADPDPRPLDALTDRQRAALLAAYDAGFFEWPRESSGEEVAADLAVSQPTFVEHLRRAQSNLLADLLDE
ncbi:GAF domain-containing protein [Halosimplex sp. TS25]|uniref:GAF domain-containing protein n=1 Tax=Halosimplex rarum TaxID=3396619 RepID=UPI0039EC6CDC